MFLIFFDILTEEQQNLVEQIFHEHHIRFHHISFRILKSDASADDAVSMAFIKIIDNIEKISELPSPLMTAFCVTIVKNTSIDIIRKSKKFANVESLDIFQDESLESLEDLYINQTSVQKLTDLLDKLSEEERKLIQLKYAQDMGYIKIGKLLGISEEAAKKRGQRIIQKLKKLYVEGELNEGEF